MYELSVTSRHGSDYYTLTKNPRKTVTWEKSGMLWTILLVFSLAAVSLITALVTVKVAFAFVPVVLVGLIAAGVLHEKSGFYPVPHRKSINDGMIQTNDYWASESPQASVLKQLDILLRRKELTTFVSDVESLKEEAFNKLELHNGGLLTKADLLAYERQLRELIKRCDDIKRNPLYASAGESPVATALGTADDIIRLNDV
jgi:hypothetical protein